MSKKTSKKTWIIEAKAIRKVYDNGKLQNEVLKGVDLNVKEGEFLVIKGRSGAGKSTLLYQLGLLDHPSSGTLLVDGVATESLTGKERTQFRLERLGYVFQDYAILPELSALENVALPLLMQGKSTQEAYEKATASLTEVGLEHRLDHLPSELSGGEQQRVSIARAISNEPKILFADEPTANLDSNTAKKIMNLFHKLHQKGQTIVMITHDYSSSGDRTVRMSDGRLK